MLCRLCSCVNSDSRYAGTFVSISSQLSLHIVLGKLWAEWPRRMICIGARRSSELLGTDEHKKYPTTRGTRKAKALSRAMSFKRCGGPKDSSRADVNKSPAFRELYSAMAQASLPE